MTAPKVWNKRDPNCPQDAVYVGRPTKWGNPYRFEGTGHPRTRQQALELYREQLILRIDRTHVLPPRFLDITKLRGKDLVCWCAPLPCHADILLEIANEEEKP